MTTAGSRIQYNTMQDNTMPCNATQCRAFFLNLVAFFLVFFLFCFFCSSRSGLVKSISSDVKNYARKMSKATMVKLQRRRESGAVPSVSPRAWLEKLPFLATFRSYKREYFASDVAAGLAEVRAGAAGVDGYGRFKTTVSNEPVFARLQRKCLLTK